MLYPWQGRGVDVPQGPLLPSQDPFQGLQGRRRHIPLNRQQSQPSGILVPEQAHQHRHPLLGETESLDSNAHSIKLAVLIRASVKSFTFFLGIAIRIETSTFLFSNVLYATNSIRGLLNTWSIETPWAFIAVFAIDSALSPDSCLFSRISLNLNVRLVLINPASSVFANVKDCILAAS